MAARSCPSVVLWYDVGLHQLCHVSWGRCEDCYTVMPATGWLNRGLEAASMETGVWLNVIADYESIVTFAVALGLFNIELFLHTHISTFNKPMISLHAGNGHEQNCSPKLVIRVAKSSSTRTLGHHGHVFVAQRTTAPGWKTQHVAMT